MGDDFTSMKVGDRKAALHGGIFYSITKLVEHSGSLQVRRLTKKPLCSIIRLHKMHNSLSNITEYDGVMSLSTVWVIRMPREATV